jgi:hypothetical protein
VAALRLLFFSGQKKVARWEIIIPMGGLAVLGYTLYRYVVPYPVGALKWLPPICIIWVVGIVAYIFLRPDVARRAGELLTQEEGLSTATGREVLAEEVVQEREPTPV